MSSNNNDNAVLALMPPLGLTHGADAASTQEQQQQPSQPSSAIVKVVIDVEVSVIIPVHNAGATIVEAVRSAMHQVICSNPTTDCKRTNSEAEAETAGELVISSSNDGNNDVSYCYYRLQVFVCCYDDGSTDDSWSLLQELQEEYEKKSNNPSQQHDDKNQIPTRLLIGRGDVSRGAGFARNRAVEMTSCCSSSSTTPSACDVKHNFLCLLDSDDYMHPTRISEQCRYLLSMKSSSSCKSNSTSNSPFSFMERTLLGCTFDRDPPDATWHYSNWANHTLTDNRLVLEQYREITLLQPTWMMSRAWFQALGGYIEAPPPPPPPSSSSSSSSHPFCLQEFISTLQAKDNTTTTLSRRVPRLRLIHPTFETSSTLRVAEDLRFFHAHLHAGGQLRLLRTTSSSISTKTATTTLTEACTDEDNKPRQHQALVTYRHASGAGQSSQTPRRLLLHLRVLAFEINVLQKHPLWQPPAPQAKSPAADNDESEDLAQPQPCFCVWGAGRDGKDFIKALSPVMRRRVACMVDVDANKILQHGYYTNRDINIYNLPILHFSLLCRNVSLRQELYQAFLRQSSTIENGDDDDDGDNDEAMGNAQPAFGRINKGRVQNIDDREKKPPPPAPAVQQQATTLTLSSSPLATSRSSRSRSSSKNKKRRLNHNNNITKQHHHNQESLEMLPSLPVVVCVAMYRTGGALERNVSMIGRTEGEDLWHFC